MRRTVAIRQTVLVVVALPLISAPIGTRAVVPTAAKQTLVVPRRFASPPIFVATAAVFSATRVRQITVGALVLSVTADIVGRVRRNRRETPPRTSSPAPL